MVNYIPVKLLLLLIIIIIIITIILLLLNYNRFITLFLIYTIIFSPFYKTRLKA